ncbi:MAG TPA: LLM class F420-dependent oxidoreductase [Mycobacteriales bacterium]|nr:LLM class F420-dependent oxidoreductase [Mycobacteriales bacterium]
MTADLKLGLMLGYWGAKPDDATETVLAAEDCGFDSVWTAEAYGSDAFTPLAWYAARTSRIKLGTGLVQISARTPAATAMSAATLDALSGGRLTLGLGVSGPQVVEGWYGVPFPKPLERTRDYVDIVRRAWKREILSSDSPHYPLPYPGGTKLGKSIKLTIHPVRDSIPILLGAEGPKNVQLATEIADGWLPIFYHVERGADLYAESLAGAPEGFQVNCPVTVVVNDDVNAAIEMVKWTLAFYIGGMGAANLNFHLNVIGRFGFADEAAVVQKHFLEGDREAAMRAVPDDLADGIALCGPLDRIRERLEMWRQSPVTTMLVGGVKNPEHLKALADMTNG